ncbi:MAG: molybdopterin converting factor subunit 1 [Bacteroidetes bacterium]|nr:molybdopterin converting factor subunit 1 [Bacteroidota bacterium]
MTVQKLKLKIFGAARDIMGGRELEIEVNGQTVGALRQTLFTLYPALKQLNSLLIAVNQKYAADDSLIHESDEIAVIPPVSGG